MSKQEVSDSELLARYRAGAVEALADLVERHRRPLYGYILHTTGGQGDADEIFQDVWFRVIRKISLYRDRNFRGWLVRIARNIIIDRSRRRKPDVSLDSENDDGLAMLDRLAADDAPPGDHAADGELGKRIAASVAELPDDQREVFVMRMQAGLKFKEIAEIQKTSINTALARMQYALAKLRPLLADDYRELGGTP